MAGFSTGASAIASAGALAAIVELDPEMFEAKVAALIAIVPTTKPIRPNLSSYHITRHFPLRLLVIGQQALAKGYRHNPDSLNGSKAE